MRHVIIGSLIVLFMILGWGALGGALAEAPASQATDTQPMDTQPPRLVNTTLAAQVIVVAILCLFLPYNALTYYLFRRHRQLFEVDRILELLFFNPKYELAYRTAYNQETSGYYFVWSVAYATLVSGLGLTLLFLGGELYPDGEFPSIPLGDGVTFPAPGSRLIAGMAFLGAYIWGFQYVLRRYALNDLTPDVYYSLSMRMILATLVAFILFNAYEALAGSDAEGLTGKVWPALACLIGMFPQRGLRWLTEHMPLVSSEVSDAVRSAPLEMIEGIESQDKWRLGELGVDSCYDLAVADFVPLVLKTPYGARQLVDWILQAKLCVYCNGGIKDLRPLGIRTILDLDDLSETDLQMLARDTEITESSLQRAKIALQNSDEIKRLEHISKLLSQFTKDGNDPSME